MAISRLKVNMQISTLWKAQNYCLKTQDSSGLDSLKLSGIINLKEGNFVLLASIPWPRWIKECTPEEQVLKTACNFLWQFSKEHCQLPLPPAGAAGAQNLCAQGLQDLNHCTWFETTKRITTCSLCLSLITKALASAFWPHIIKLNNRLSYSSS